MIKAVTFDVGGTLIEPFPSVGGIYADAASRHGLTIDPTVLQENFQSTWKSRAAGEPLITREWWEDVVRSVFRDFPMENFDSLFNDLYAEFGKPGRWRVFDDVPPTLNRLHKMNIRLAVASNWDERLPELLEKLALAGRFERQFISCCINAVKPQKKFFRHIAADLGLSPSEILHVGDDPEKDAAAAGCGFKFFHVDRSRPGFSLAELLSFIDGNT